jgi:glyoxylase-like metal-dependent hydrolase (beta-lactamase superfamily II)
MTRPRNSGILRSLQVVTGDLEENCYLLWTVGAKEAVVFDPGDEPEKIRAALNEHSLTPAAFVLTHCHGDHIGALTPLKADFPKAPIYVPEAEREWLVRPLLNLSYFVGGSVTGPRAEHMVCDGDVLDLIGLKLRAIHVPGHSPGGTAYFVEDSKGGAPHLFCGDILFQGSIGRTDLPGGAGETTLVNGIRGKLFILPDETRVHTGHGPETTIGEEKEFNPYCGLGDGGIA